MSDGYRIEDLQTAADLAERAGYAANSIAQSAEAPEEANHSEMLSHTLHMLARDLREMDRRSKEGAA